MRTLLVIQTFLSLSNLSCGGWKISKINLKTSNVNWGGTDGMVFARLITCTGRECFTSELKNLANINHEMGDFNIYTLGQLGDCYNFNISSQNCDSFTATVNLYDTNDGWSPEYIQFQDETGKNLIHCELGKWLDNCGSCKVGQEDCCLLKSMCNIKKKGEGTNGASSSTLTDNSDSDEVDRDGVRSVNISALLKLSEEEWEWMVQWRINQQQKIECMAKKQVLKNNIMDTYNLMINGMLCEDTFASITNELECIAATNELNLTYANSWDGPGDFPYCLQANDGRNKVYFNRSPQASTTASNKMYASICKKIPGVETIIHRNITIGTGSHLAGCMIKNNVFYPDNTIKNKTTKGVGECANLCVTVQKCIFWSFSKFDNQCQLKTANSGERNDIDKISGSKLCAECGISNEQKKRISGGTVVIPNQYPWMVRLPWGCGGSLITDRHILTAKHCLDGVNIRGEYNGMKWKPGTMLKISVHNQFDKNDYEEVPMKNAVWPNEDDIDIGIIILEQAINLCDKTISTVCLPSDSHLSFIGQKGYAMGWGWSPDAKGQSDLLLHIELKVVRENETTLETKVEMSGDIPIDVCSGDSGGPLVVKVLGRWTVIGTVWGGDICSNHQQENGGWSRVTAHLPWINQIINDPLLINSSQHLLDSSIYTLYPHFIAGIPWYKRFLYWWFYKFW